MGVRYSQLTQGRILFRNSRGGMKSRVGKDFKGRGRRGGKGKEGGEGEKGREEGEGKMRKGSS